MGVERSYALLSVTAKPGSTADGVSVDGERIEVRVRARPVDGAANEAIVRVIARAAGVAPSRVQIERGTRGRTKRVRIEGISDAQAWERLRA